MQEIIEMLKEAGFVDTLQRCINSSHKLMPAGEREAEQQLECSKHVLKEFLKGKGNDKILDKFVDFATDFTVEAIIKELDLKPDESYEPSAGEDALASLLKLIKTILK